MFEEPLKSLVDILVFLLPGFFAGWVFYGLTSHPKPAQFERLIQALIFTFIIQAIASPLKWELFFTAGESTLYGASPHYSMLITLAVALGLGFVFAFLANQDFIHKSLRRVGLTSRTSHPSEWFYVFSEKVTFVVLELCDGRRLYGWPKEWPIDPRQGQFYLMEPSWILEDNSVKEMPELDGILIPASEVRWVEFLNVD